MHNKIDDCWIIIAQEVIDITPYVKNHPGGPDSLRLVAGTFWLTFF
jgi:cytochrome b involved in lipid metabolism